MLRRMCADAAGACCLVFILTLMGLALIGPGLTLGGFGVRNVYGITTISVSTKMRAFFNPTLPGPTQIASRK